MLFQDCLIGAGVGAIVGKALVHRTEQRGTELTGSRVRHIEIVWMGFGVSVTLLFRVSLS